MAIICNTRCTNALLTGTQRYTQKILYSYPGNIEKIAPSPKNSRGMKGHLWEQFVLPSLVGKNLLWSPSNSGPVFAQRQVVTLHDLVSFDHPEWLNKTYVKWYNVMLPAVLKKADHIIAISKFTKQRLMELFKIPESKITLIYNGTDHIVPTSGTDETVLEIPFKKYVLSLGSLEPRKNIPLLLHAWENISKKIPDDVGLVVVGGVGNHKVYNDAGIIKIPNRVHFTGHIKDEYVNQLYSNALFFTYLSVYEGFGLPPLEAMSAGIPVLSSNVTAMPEVIEEAGILIDPFSLSECESALIKLINDESLRSALSSKSLIQSKKFDWKDTAKKTHNVLQHFA